MNKQPNTFFSQILQTIPNKQKNPQFLRIKNNILLIILCMSSVGIYYLFSDFMNVILLAFIGGVSYQQIRDRCIKFWKSQQPYRQKQLPLRSKVISTIFCLFLIPFMPWVKSVFSNPNQLQHHFQIGSLYNSFKFQTHPVVLLLQFLLLIKVLHILFAPKIVPLIAGWVPRHQACSRFIFGLAFVIVTLFCITIISSLFLMEMSESGFWIQNQVKQHFKCEIMRNSNQHNQQLPLCTDLFFQNNTYVIQAMRQFKAQTSQIQECMTHLSSIQNRIIGDDIFKYKQFACSWFLIIQKAVLYFTPEVDVLSTGTTFFKTIFGNIAFIIMSFSNIIFDLTTFFTVFFFTIGNFNAKSKGIQDIFYGERRKLFEQIANLIQASIFILVEHFLLSIILLQMFDFSNFNMIIATLLSSMAFVPFFRPSFGMLLLCAIRLFFIRDYLFTIIYWGVYYYMSEKIFEQRLQPMDFHLIVTNLSVLFGIYEFGMAGIFYGPILLILFRCVHHELLRNQFYNKNETQME